MHNDSQNNEQPDIFSEKIRQKLEYHEVPVDDDIWDGVEQKLHSRPKKILFLPWFIGVTITVAAASSIVLFSTLSSQSFVSDNIIEDKPNNKRHLDIYFSANTDKIMDDSEDMAALESEISNDQIKNGLKNEFFVEPVKTDENSYKNTEKKKLDNSIFKNHPESEKIISAKNKDEGKISGNKILKQEKKYPDHALVVDTFEKQLGKTVQTKEQENDVMLSAFESSFINSELNADNQLEKSSTIITNSGSAIKTEENIATNKTLLAENATDNIITREQTNDKINKQVSVQNDGHSSDEINFSKTSVKNNNNYTKENRDWHLGVSVAFDRFPDFTSFPPIAFDLRVRKDVSRWIGFETGIIYSHLRTNYKDTETGFLSAIDDLHYVGIPLNVVFRAWHNRRWDIYSSIGGTVEKGIKSVCTRYTYNDDHTVDTEKESENIKGLQCSVHFQVGVNYDFFKGLGAFIEPECMYYFRSNQPVSVYTVNPFKISMKVGLRYKFE